MTELEGICEHCGKPSPDEQPQPHLCPPLSQELRQRIEARRKAISKMRIFGELKKAALDEIDRVLREADSLARRERNQ